MLPHHPQWFIMILSNNAGDAALYQIGYPSAITPIQGFLALALAFNHWCLWGFPKCTNPAKDSIALLKCSHRGAAAAAAVRWDAVAWRWGWGVKSQWQANSLRHFCWCCCKIECEVLHRGRLLTGFSYWGRSWMSERAHIDVSTLHLHPAALLIFQRDWCCVRTWWGQIRWWAPNTECLDF